MDALRLFLGDLKQERGQDQHSYGQNIGGGCLDADGELEEVR